MPDTSATPQASLRITEIFHSLQGESTRVGLPTVFIRLTGCPLRCVWCDTEHAFSGGKSWPLQDVLAKVASFACPVVCVTGGEPLAQKDCTTLLTALCDAAYAVSLETSGALDLAGVDRRVAKVMDIKAPGSGEVEKNLWSNLAHLTPRDEIKFVLSSPTDYDWAIQIMQQKGLHEICPVLFSPVPGQLDPALLADWILRDRLPVRYQLQLHKILWGAAQGK